MDLDKPQMSETFLPPEEPKRYRHQNFLPGTRRHTSLSMRPALHQEFHAYSQARQISLALSLCRALEYAKQRGFFQLSDKKIEELDNLQ